MSHSTYCPLGQVGASICLLWRVYQFVIGQLTHNSPCPGQFPATQTILLGKFPPGQFPIWIFPSWTTSPDIDKLVEGEVWVGVVH